MALGIVGGELDKLALELRFDEVRRPVENHHRLFAVIRGLQLGPQRGGLAHSNFLEVHFQSGDALGIMLTPVSRWSDKTAFFAGLCGRKHGSTFVQGLPIWQARAALVHVAGVPPVFTGHRVVGAVVHCAGFERLLEGIIHGTFPDFHLEIHVTRCNRSELQLGIGGLVFHVHALGLEHIAHHIGQNDLAGPVVRDDLDGGLVICGQRRPQGERSENAAHHHGLLQKVHITTSY